MNNLHKSSTTLLYNVIKEFSIRHVPFILIPLLLSGCTKYATVTALKPSESTRTAHIKTLSVGTFEQDTLALSQKIQTSLSNLHPYFTVISPHNNPAGFVRGAITSKSIDFNPYNVERSECIDRECHKRRTYRLICITKSSSLNATIQIVDSKSHEILFASNEYTSMEQNHCPDDPYTITSDEDHFALLSNQIAQNFANRLIPSSVTYHIELMDKSDIPLTALQKEQFETVLNEIENNRPDKALNSLQALSNSIKSYVLEYDLGVVFEIMGRLDEARIHYRNADTMISQPMPLINNALSRIERSIYDRNAVALQIKQ